MTYTECISQFEVFENPPKKKGYHRHHIVPTCEQKKLYGSVIDNRQIYVSLPMHMWLHILYDREHHTNTAKRFLSVCNKPADYFDCWEKCLAYGYTLRKTKEKRDKKLAEACRTPEAKQQKSDIMKEIWSSPERRQKMSDLKKKAYSNPEYRQKLSDSHKGNTNAKGRKWFNNNVKDVMAYECPEGFVSGRLNYKRPRLSQNV